MGRVENGVESISDPAMAYAQFDEEDDVHPETDESRRNLPGWWEDLDCLNERTMYKGVCKDSCVQQSYSAETFKNYLLKDVLFLQ